MKKTVLFLVLTLALVLSACSNNSVINQIMKMIQKIQFQLK